jgi:uncharacterized protein YhfF
MHNLSYKYKQILSITAIIGFLFVSTNVFGQHRARHVEDYINRWAPTAMDHQQRYGIPASIKLAQAILESGAGVSDLARRSNNHFGIKADNRWAGPRVNHADDTPYDQFRRYARVEDSFDDHSQFLRNNPRYSSLFNLRITDYRSWARGLQQAGYATDRNYANKLINLIELYELYRFDNPNYRPNMTPQQRVAAQRESVQIVNRHQPYRTHGLVYVIAQQGDTFAAIAQEFGFRERDLLRFNEVGEGFPLQEGDIVYFQRKHTRALPEFTEHVVQMGESMHSISQMYGIRMRNLYRLNKKRYSYVPEIGDVLRLR